MPNQEASEEVPTVVNVSGQGTQVGAGSTMINNWGDRQPLDPTSLSALNPHVAVARLQRLTHDELVDFFARATLGDLSEIFPTFLESDEASVIATLADINERKAAKLIDTCCVEAVLVALPEAAKAIARKAVVLKWTDAGPLERFSEGYARRYKNGRIFWDDGTCVHVTVGVIDDYARISGPKWGVPIGDEEPVRKSPFDTLGIRQEFQVGTVYSSAKGTYRVIEEECYAREGSSYGWLGLPVGEIEANPRIGDFQRFEGGIIYSGIGKERVALSVQKDVVDAFPASWEIRPLSEEVDTVSSAGTVGFVQDFECMDWEVFRAVTYTTGGHEVVPVTGEILTYYIELGAEKSRLGFPTSSVVGLSKTASVQSFEKGLIYIKPDGLIAVSDRFAKVVPDGCAPHEMLGFPISEEQSIDASESGGIQFFENGVITLNNEHGEMWVRPQSNLAPVIYVDHRISEPEWTNVPSEPEDDGFVDD